MSGTKGLRYVPGPMELYILRHGIAADKGDPRYPNDEDRPLTEEGQKKTLKVARRMKELGLSFDLILSSPLPRARQTAEITASVLGCKNKLKFSSNLAPEGTKKGLIQELSRKKPAPKRLLLVGHEPYLTELISTLLIGKPGLPIELKKGGLCKLQIERVTYGRCAILQVLVPPKVML
jgi:phosphohistidine phosphatase